MGSFLRLRGFRTTPARKAILDAAYTIHGHFEAEDLFLKLRRQKGLKISRATVYRTLPLLVKCGLLREVLFTDKHSHYEHIWGHEHHEHLVCLDCGRVFEFQSPELEKVLDLAARNHRFRPSGHKVEITGYCEKCRGKKPGRGG